MNKVVISIYLCLCLSAGPALAQEITPEKAHQYGEAYGAVLGFVKSMDYVGAQCGQYGKGLTAVWQERNTRQQAQAEALLRKFLAQVAKQYGQKSADDVEARLRQQINEMQATAVTKSFAALVSLPADQKAIVCRKFVASVHSGAWDVEKKNPGLYKYLAVEAQ